MIFVFPNMWAHWNVFLAMYQFGRSGISARYFRIFCFLMLAGDVVKLVFFAVHDFSMLNIARYVRLRISSLVRDICDWQAESDLVVFRIFRSCTRLCFAFPLCILSCWCLTMAT